jgi:hypothetical protein
MLQFSGEGWCMLGRAVKGREVGRGRC